MGVDNRLLVCSRHYDSPMVDYDLYDNALVGLVTLALEGAQGLRLVQSGARSVGEMFSGRRGKPVRVEREGDSLSVDLNVSVDYGQPIPELARNAQRLVAEALSASTGLKVRAVNLTVVAVEYREGGGAA
jgi:uncharacterized alkaline shock family protein YloU